MKLLLSIVFAVLCLVACSGEETDNSAFTGDLTKYDIAAQLNVPGGEQAPVGACIHLSGNPSRPNFNLLQCDDSNANYRITARVLEPNQCPADADQRYYQNQQGSHWTACLDYAWNPSACISISGPIPQKADCSNTSLAKREKAIKLLDGVTDAAQCPSGGFAHPVRRFTVCTESQK